MIGTTESRESTSNRSSSNASLPRIAFLLFVISFIVFVSFSFWWNPLMRLSSIHHNVRFVTITELQKDIGIGRNFKSKEESVHLGLKEQSKKPMIISSFIFNGEPMALYHLHYLKDVVDLFVIVEMKQTFSGIMKQSYALDRLQSALKPLEDAGKLLKLYVEKYPYEEEFYRISNKSTPLTAADFEELSKYGISPIQWSKQGTEGLLPWARERYVRDYPVNMIRKLYGSTNQPFILIFGDADEIPRKEIVAQLPTVYSHPVIEHGLNLDMITFYYSFKWVIPKERFKYAMVINDVGLRVTPSLNQFRWYESRYNTRLSQSGWHCSYFMSPEKAAQKIQSYAQQEDNTPHHTDLRWIQKCMDEGVDIFERKGKSLKKYNGEEGYPFCETCKTFVPQFHSFNLPFSSR